MKLYLLERIGDTGYDECIGHLIRAESEEIARTIANDNPGDEGPIWHNKEKVSCEEITMEGSEGILITNFHAG